MPHWDIRECCRWAVFGCLVLAPTAHGDDLDGEHESERDRQNANVARQLMAIVRNDGGLFPAPARATAAQTIGKMGSDARAVIPEVIGILSNPVRCYPFVVDDALVKALAEMGLFARPAIPAMVRNVGKDRDLDRAINESVGRILTAVHLAEDLAVLVRLLKSSDSGERLRAAKKIATFGPDGKSAIPDLTTALLDPDRDVSRQALLALAAIRPGLANSRQAVAVYVRDLSDPDEAVRLRAAKSLAKLGPAARPALSALQAAARNDPDEDVRRVATDAMARIPQGPTGGP